MLDQLKSADFAPYLNQTFWIRLESGGSIETVLSQVTDLSDNRLGAGREQRQAFSLIFRGPQQPVLPQQIYQLDHQVMGSLSLFIVPIGPDQTGMRYEAIFT